MHYTCERWKTFHKRYFKHYILCMYKKNKNGSRLKLRQDVNADTTKFTSAGRRLAFGKKD